MTGVLALLGREWKLAIAALFAAGFFFVLSQRDVARARADVSSQALKAEQAGRSADRERADRQRADQERGFAQQLAGATSTFADRLAAREPIIVHSRDTVREYAETAAGRVVCRGADRVRAIDALDAALAGEDTAAAPRGADAVLPDSAAPPAGR
ncbi:hypothetical protein [Sphingomonas endophytica]|uniref:Uncharacterized protein n=1 Tax=Sphingomonas endophytica TaxID=869719 RepID=A0A147I3F1_9SPHN|nr:hypothetical protein [Sphingomonas endophytica]KTT72608.1 hypothetical protein NS334_08410 [Sphingomonas endophytica]